MFGGVAIELEAPLVDYEEHQEKPGDDASGQYEPPTLENNQLSSLPDQNIPAHFPNVRGDVCK